VSKSEAFVLKQSPPGDESHRQSRAPLAHESDAKCSREIKHVALPKQTIRSVLIEDNATVDLRRDLECDSGRNVRLDYAGDHIRARSLRCDDDMIPAARAICVMRAIAVSTSAGAVCIRSAQLVDDEPPRKEAYRE